MDLSLNSVYEALTETLYLELKNATAPNSEQIARFKEWFSMSVEKPGLYYNEFNLIITDRETFAEMETIIKASAITTKIECREHNLFVVVYPYFNDALVRQALED